MGSVIVQAWGEDRAMKGRPALSVWTISVNNNQAVNNQQRFYRKRNCIGVIYN